MTASRKLDNFIKCLSTLQGADFSAAGEDDIYRTGVTAQFSLTFELAWKALQEMLRAHGVESARTGSPREILQLAFKMGFINDETIWLSMLRHRNASAHEYDESMTDELILLIKDSYLPAFQALKETLENKLTELDTDSKE